MASPRLISFDLGVTVGLIRLILILLLVWVAWRLLKQTLLSGPGQGSSEGKEGSSNSATRMVKCEQCGVHLPEAEAVREEQNFFCGQSHLLEWQKRDQND